MRDKSSSSQTETNTLPSTNRRTFLQCMTWAGAGLVWTMSGGVPRSLGFTNSAYAEALPKDDAFTFVQISDSHIGFNKDPNMDPASTLQEAIADIKRINLKPSLLLHTGDVSQLSKPEQFDTAEQIIRGAGLDTHYVPGEHDTLIDSGKPFFARFSAGAENGWYSFDQRGVHFIGLVNVVELKEGGLGYLGPKQLEWLERDVKGLSASTPIVVFAHMPLWSAYADWGWGTQDAAQALTYLKRFGSVTVLNGHIHQIMQKVEGNVSFHTARSTAFPQSTPGSAAGPGPLVVPAGTLKSVLGIATIQVEGNAKRATITDRSLAEETVAQHVDPFAQSVFLGG
ncbi:MAG: metallophosphoesterase [Verrucomicrobiaceae bacterium]|nr:metallophosphoesterase [Verrucomicrobiaceae bacterium]